MEAEIITKYISVWSWQILSIIFLCFSLLFFTLPRTTLSIVFYVSFFLIFVGTQFVSYKRRKELISE